MVTVLATVGCASIMPPEKIPADRLNYLDAVSASWKEQLLRNVVALRYGEALTSLEMTSITTAYELDSNLNAGNTAYLHVGPARPAYDVASVGGYLTYSIKPTITYVPIRGDALQKTMMEPISPLRILKGLQCGWEADFIFPCSVRCINELRSPWDHDFFVFADKFQDLKTRGVIRIVVEELVEPKVTKVPDEIAITLNDKRQGTEKNEPEEEQCVKDAPKPKPRKNCEEEADMKKKDKEDSPIGFLVVDHYRARSQDEKDSKELEDFKAFVSKSFDACLEGKSFTKEDANTEPLKGCLSGSLKNVGIDRKPGAECTTLKDCVSKSLHSCYNNMDCLSISLHDSTKYESLQDKVKSLEILLWPKYKAMEPIWQTSYHEKCEGCHFTTDNKPKFQNCDFQKIAQTVACAKSWKHTIEKVESSDLDKIENIKSDELKGIISFLKHSSEGYEVYKVIDADQKLPLDPYYDTIVMQTQSILQTLTILSRLIEVPDDHKTKKKTEPYKANYRDMSDILKLKISSQTQCPQNAFVAIKYNDYWFFIDDDDYQSKQAFTSIEGIFSMSETGTKEGTPVLTLPVQ
ncbi:MAG: hypothetical protein WB930_19230 [Syntrophobacteraceae bacterium]